MKQKKRGKEGRWDAVVDFDIFRERTSDFSLKYRAIRPSEVVGIRRKAALRIETYAWAPVSGVFDKLREVGVSSYLTFYTLFKCFTMFRLV